MQPDLGRRQYLFKKEKVWKTIVPYGIPMETLTLFMLMPEAGPEAKVFW